MSPAYWPFETLSRARLQHQPSEKSRVPQTLPAQVVPYLEEDPSIKEWLFSFKPTRRSAHSYFHSLVPFTSWLPRYNLHWLLGDAIAGLTVGFVVVPQAMAYASLAGLGPEYGLYTSFMGAALYWLFGTSKDVVVGTTAVGSLLVGEVIARVQAEKPSVYASEDIAKAVSLLSGIVLLLLGFLRLGWLIELISYVSISAFVTAASITIIGTQLPVILGITGIKTREAPYKVYVSVLQRLGHAKLDAAIGLTSIALLFCLKTLFTHLEKRQPGKKGLWSTLSSLRMTFTIVLYTLVSWLVHRKLPHGEHKFRLVGHIDSGFTHAGVPVISTELLGLIAPSVPSMVIILIIEHVAIAKSFSRQFGYEINPSQEIIAQGSSNVLGIFVGGYACTGSFGASAVLSKAGAKTPLATLFSAGLLLLALYALTSVFYFIPMAALAGLIIHAVVNLMMSSHTLHRYWRLSPFEFLIWVVGVFVAMFTKLETSIYTTVALSFALLLVRMAKSKGAFLEKTSMYRILHQPEGSEPQIDRHGSTQMLTDTSIRSRTVYLPADSGRSFPRIETETTYPGVFIYRFNEAYNYINNAQHMTRLVSHIKARTRPATQQDSDPPQDRLWSIPASVPAAPDVVNLPVLHAIVLDCSAINNLDIASIQGLEDARKSLEHHTASTEVEWHFAGLLNPWARRALSEAGFGISGGDASRESLRTYEVARCATIAVKQGSETGRGWALEGHDANVSLAKVADLPLVDEAWAQPLYGVDRPFFHIDVVDAVDAAIRCAEGKARCRDISTRA